MTFRAFCVMCWLTNSTRIPIPACQFTPQTSGLRWRCSLAVAWIRSAAQIGCWRNIAKSHPKYVGPTFVASLSLTSLMSRSWTTSSEALHKWTVRLSASCFTGWLILHTTACVAVWRVYLQKISSSHLPFTTEFSPDPPSTEKFPSLLHMAMTVPS